MIPRMRDALASLRPGASWAWTGTDYAGLVWHSDGAPPTEAEIAAELDRLLAAYEAAEYARLRAAEYPGFDALIVALWESVIEGRPASAAELQALRQAIKDKYPRP